jgi:hypothetical protein
MIYEWWRVTDRPAWPPGAEIQAQAYDAFEIWRREYDPDGDRDIFEMVELYAKSKSNGG